MAAGTEDPTHHDPKLPHEDSSLELSERRAGGDAPSLTTSLLSAAERAEIGATDWTPSPSNKTPKTSTTPFCRASSCCDSSSLADAARTAGVLLTFAGLGAVFASGPAADKTKGAIEAAVAGAALFLILTALSYCVFKVAPTLCHKEDDRPSPTN